MARFITINHILDNTTVQKNVQADLLEPFIDVAQPMYILRMLGIAQYEALENAINTAGSVSAVTGVNATLLNKIKPALVYATWYESFPFLRGKITNKGVLLKNSENESEQMSDQFFKDLRQSVKNWMEFWLDELLRFLRSNKTVYTLWREEIFSTEQRLSGATYTNLTSYSSGIIFDKYDNDGYDERLNFYK